MAAAGRDVQDILDVKQSDVGRTKKKAPKPKLARPKHIPKEVWLLETQGDRAPPVALTAPAPKKPKFNRPVKPWEWQAFTHPNRSDGLVLHHWRQKVLNPAEVQQDNGPATPAEGNAAGSSAAQDKTVKPEPRPDGLWAKYNVKVDLPKYSAEEYQTRLQSDEWSKEETDYLMELCEDFDLRWIVIADRYDFQPNTSDVKDENTMAVAPLTKTRTMEEMKARYYQIAAIMMDVRMGLSNMTTAEFNLHEKMTKFDPAKESKRKRMVEQLLQRSQDEVIEERRLLIELKRIIEEEDDFLRERTELFERLNAPASRQSIAQFESSQGLVQLMQNLLMQDKARSRNAAMSQRRALAGVEEPKDKTNSPATPAGGAAPGRGSDSRKSLDSTTAGATGGGPGSSRKDSKASHSHTPSFVRRQLTKEEERKFGVQRPQKLLTGEKIRHLRIEKRVTARASSVAAKVQDSMVELGIPIKPVMATGRVVAGYEELCANLDALLDYKRHSEKTENEIKVLTAQKEIKEGKTQEGAEGDGSGESGEKKGKQKEGEKDEEAEAETSNETERSTEKSSTSKKGEGDEDKGDDDDDDDDDGAQEGEDGEAREGDKVEEGDADADGSGEHDEDDDAVRNKSDDDDEDEEGDAGSAANGEEDNDDVDVEADAGGNDAGDDDGDGDGEGEENAVENGEESRPSTRASGRSGGAGAGPGAGGRKRSVSVLSSAPSQKSTKRQRK